MIENKASRVSTAYKLKDATTETDLDNIVEQIKPFLSSSRLVHVKTVLQQNKIQYARTNGQYKYWVNKRPIGSPDLLARYISTLDSTLHVAQGEFLTMTCISWLCKYQIPAI